MSYSACLLQLAVLLSKWVSENGNMILEVTAVKHHPVTLIIIGSEGCVVSVDHTLNALINTDLRKISV